MNEQQRKQYHSIPLRSQARPATRERNTETSGVIPQRIDSRAAAPMQSLVSHWDMPAVPDDDRRQAHTPKSAWLWDKDGNPVLRQGKKEMVFHKTRPRQVHWLFLVGLGMVATLLLWIGAQWTIASIQAHSIDAQYGMPRTYQVDAVVGHGDSAAHPSHFIFENLSGHIIIIEIPGGNIAHAHIYGGPTLMGPDADQVPVTGRFEDVNGDGRPDMLVSIGTGTNSPQTITYLNNGSAFIPQS